MLLAAAAEWVRQGVHCEILGNAERAGSFAHALAQVGYVVHHVPLSGWPVSLVRLARFVRGRGYDVVHVHTERANFSIGLACRWGCSKQVIRTIHSNFPYQGMLRLVRMAQRRALTLMGVRHVAISTGVQDTEREWLHNSTRLIWNWYDDTHFQPPGGDARRLARARFSIADQEYVISTVGNCSPIKNHAALLEALAMLPSDAPIRYIHVGNEGSGHPERALAAKLGVSGKVTFAGDMDDPRQALYAADAFVQPSLREGFSIAALEALAVGLPAVLSDTPGLRDLRCEFPALIYVQPDAPSIAEGLRQALRESQALRLRASTDHPTIAQRRFGMGRGVSAYAALYRGDPR